MAKSKQIQLTVVTPEKQVLAETVDDVVIPAHDGELGVLPDRSSLMCELGIGQMRFHINGQLQRFFIDGGFAQVHQNNVAVLTTRAIPATDITNDLISAEEKTAANAGAKAGGSARQSAYRRVSTMRALRSTR